MVKLRISQAKQSKLKAALGMVLLIIMLLCCVASELHILDAHNHHQDPIKEFHRIIDWQIKSNLFKINLVLLIIGLLSMFFSFFKIIISCKLIEISKFNDLYISQDIKLAKVRFNN